MQSYCADEGIDAVIARYKNMVYGIALSQASNPGDADDIFQEVFLAYFKKERRFESEEHRKAWLIRTAVNHCRKANSPRREIPAQTMPERGFVFALPEENALFSALRGIPSQYRIALTLFYFDGLSCSETARALRITPGAVRMRLSRGRELLRQELKGDYFDE